MRCPGLGWGKEVLLGGGLNDGVEDYVMTPVLMPGRLEMAITMAHLYSRACLIISVEAGPQEQVMLG